VSAALNVVGLLVMWLSLALLAPALVAVIYGEPVTPFLASLAIGGSGGWVLQRVTAGAGEFSVRDAFLTVSLAWVAASAVGGLPYIFEGGEIARPVDAYFEAMSGFTTTGSSVMADIEGHGRAILFWRSLTQWLGGMGIIVLAVAILPRMGVGGRQLMESEAPGPDLDKLAPRLRDTARRLWMLYVGFTLVEMVLLALLGAAGVAPGMDLYNAVSHGLTTMATGGFSPEGRSLEEFGPWVQWVVTAFMLAAGVNFALWYRALLRHPRALRRDEEFRLYLLVVAAATALLTTFLLVGDVYREGHDAVRHAAFQAVSIVTTTGYASADFAAWTPVTFQLLVLLMFVGGCAGSTSGGVKVVRWLVAARAMRREVRTTVHPEAVQTVRVSGRSVEERTVRSALAFVLGYVVLAGIGTTVLLLDAGARGLDLTPFEGAAAAATTIGNIGPAFGSAGPMGSFAGFSDVSTVAMSTLMWLGRLELLPVLALVTRSYWLR
jgi:trk system potassium uptake protein TrkH